LQSVVDLGHPPTLNRVRCGTTLLSGVKHSPTGVKNIHKRSPLGVACVIRKSIIEQCVFVFF
jgi:hypothetical protein